MSVLDVSESATVFNDDEYRTGEERGKNWEFWLGDSTSRIREIEDERVELSIFSPPFQSLFVYSSTPRDMGNSLDLDDFIEQYSMIASELLRITKAGRMCCVHCAQIATSKNWDGVAGLIDFRGRLIEAHLAQGWIFHGEVTVQKDPQVQAIRTKAPTLMFTTKNRDSLKSRPALADYLLIFRKPGDAEVKVKTDVTNEEWIEYAAPVWLNIEETNVLNAKIARDAKDERHMTPLQLDFIDRCIRLWTNPGETVFSPFGGIGSELWQAIKRGRKALGIELKPSYWATGCRNLRQLESELSAPTLFDQSGRKRNA